MRALAAVAMSPAVSNAARRVLVVGATDRDNERWEGALRGAGLAVELEPDLERALLIAAELRPSAIALDLARADGDALQLASALRADRRTCDTVIVALAPEVSLDVVALARRCGCDAVLSSHASPAVLAAVLLRALSRRARRAA